MPVTVQLSGEGIEFEREVPEDVALNIMELSFSNGADTDTVPERTSTDDAQEEQASATDTPEALPSNFFTRLSTKQEALIHVLHDADEPLTSTELRQRMQDEHDVSTGGGRALAGILAGFTRKYGDDFEIVRVDWGDGEGLYQLNPDRPQYIEEIAEYFDG